MPSSNEEPYTGSLSVAFQYDIVNTGNLDVDDEATLAILKNVSTIFVEGVVADTFGNESDSVGGSERLGKARVIAHHRLPAVYSSPPRQRLLHDAPQRRGERRLEVVLSPSPSAVQITGVEKVTCDSPPTAGACQRVTVEAVLALVDEPKNATEQQFQGAVAVALEEPDAMTFPPDSGLAYAGPANDESPIASSTPSSSTSPTSSFPPSSGALNTSSFIPSSTPSSVALSNSSSFPSPTPSSGASSSSTAPTSIPPGATYYNGFELGAFPDKGWSTEGNGTWFRTTERAHSGLYSIKSPDIKSMNLTQGMSNATLAIGDAEAGDGVLHFSILVGTEMPFDEVLYYVDGQLRGQFQATSEFESQQIELEPGPHVVTFSYRYNPVGLEVFPPAQPDSIGAMFIDDVYFVPGDGGSDMSPTRSPVIGNSTTSSSPTSGTELNSTSSPTVSEQGTSSPTVSEQGTSKAPISSAFSAAPTSLPPDALYYTGFEQATFPGDPGWSTTGDGVDAVWGLTTERAKSGVYSIKSPDLSNDDLTQLESNATFTTNSTWGGGTFVFSVLAGVSMPFDNFRYTVDGQERGGLTDKSAFETMQIALGPGPHEIVFKYQFNPATLSTFPPDPPNRIGAVYIDDVYFLPAGVTVAPTASLVTASPKPTVAGQGTSPAPSSIPTVLGQGTSKAPTPASVPSTIAPSSVPPGAEYYDGFETGNFPNDPEWTTQGDDGLWEITSEKANTGVYSIKTPEFVNSENQQTSSNVTLTTNPSWPSGSLVFSILSSVSMPYDKLVYYVDGNVRGEASDEAKFTINQIQLGPGQHTVTFSYQMNPANLDALPPLPAGGIEPVFIDDVYFLPEGFTIAPTGQSMTVPPSAAPNLPVNLPTTSPAASVKVPTSSPSGGADRGPTTCAPVSFTSVAPTLPSDAFFDGFETGDFSGLEWNITGEQKWVVDNTNPFQGNFSAHVKTEDIEISQDYSQLNLGVTLGSAAFIQFYFYAPVQMPFESFDLWVDDQFMTGLSTEDEKWTQAGAILSSGQHTIAWRLTKNPRGVPDSAIENLPQEPYRKGEVWLDDVSLQSSTPSFVEGWESGDFTAHPWILSGDAEWSITDSIKYEGCYSATIASNDFEVNSGVSELSINLITEEGGILKFEILPSVAGPFDTAEVFIDETAVVTYTTPVDDWVAQEITIQPGKRRVAFKFSKNPNQVPEEVLPTLSAPEGHQGNIFLDAISFEVTSP